MKIRNGFVSNSSSTAFIITNKSNKKLTIADFALENMHLLAKFNEQFRSGGYEWDKPYTENQYLESADMYAKQQNMKFKPKEEKYCIFGDESQTALGTVYDYILRGGGESKNWSWRF